MAATICWMSMGSVVCSFCVMSSPSYSRCTSDSALFSRGNGTRLVTEINYCLWENFWINPRSSSAEYQNICYIMHLSNRIDMNQSHQNAKHHPKFPNINVNYNYSARCQIENRSHTNQWSGSHIPTLLPSSNIQSIRIMLYDPTKLWILDPYAWSSAGRQRWAGRGWRPHAVASPRPLPPRRGRASAAPPESKKIIK